MGSMLSVVHGALARIKRPAAYLSGFPEVRVTHDMTCRIPPVFARRQAGYGFGRIPGTQFLLFQVRENRVNEVLVHGPAPRGVAGACESKRVEQVHGYKGTENG